MLCVNMPFPNSCLQLHLRIHTSTYVHFCQHTMFLKEHFCDSAGVLRSLELLLVGVVELSVCDVLAVGDGEVGDVG